MAVTSLAELSDSGNDRIAMGANMSPFDSHKVNVDNLFEEAQAWLNGDGVNNHAEAEAVELLLDMARQAKKAADEARKLENEPFDTGKAEVQARYNPVLKRADTVADACKQVLAPYRQKIEADKRAVAEAARLDAERIRREAEEAMRSSAGNVTERERAEEKLALAKDAEKFARRTDKAAATGNGLRTVWETTVTDPRALAGHYWKTRSADVDAFFHGLAKSDVHNGARSIPGCVITETKKAL